VVVRSAIVLILVTCSASVALAGEVRGGPGDDTLVGTSAADVLIGLGGDDELYGGRGPDQLYGGAGHDRLFGGDGDDLLVDGGQGARFWDQLRGGASDDRLIGGPGADVLRGDHGNDLLDGRDRAPRRLSAATDDPTRSRDYEQGGPGDDTILTRDGRPDSVSCGPGDDVAITDALDLVAGCETHRRR
jgi:Ca2+-binding RTX toxin-like protein